MLTPLGIHKEDRQPFHTQIGKNVPVPLPP